MLLVCRFAPDDPDAFMERGRRAVELLVAQPGCRSAELGRGVDEPGEWVLVAVFDSVTAYRRSLSPFEVREHVVPWLSEADASDTSTFERRLVGGPEGVTEQASLLDPGGPRPR